MTNANAKSHPCSPTRAAELSRYDTGVLRHDAAITHSHVPACSSAAMMGRPDTICLHRVQKKAAARSGSSSCEEALRQMTALQPADSRARMRGRGRMADVVTTTSCQPPSTASACN